MMKKFVLARVTTLGRYGAFVLDILKYSVRPPFRLNLYFEEIERLGVNSIPIIVLAGLAIGMIFSLQMVSLLQPFKAEIGVGAAVAIALGRELAPIITTLMLIAKNGSAMAAELGTMKVTEQVDALESMSIVPVQYLVVPRVAASIIVFPLLTIVANIVGVIGAYFIAIYLYNVDSANYTSYMFRLLSPADIYAGLLKSAIMGFIVSSISAFYGLGAKQGAKGVGDGATSAVVASSVAILIADYVLASIMMKVLF